MTNVVFIRGNSRRGKKLFPSAQVLVQFRKGGERRKPSEFLVIRQDMLAQLLRSAPVQQLEMASGEFSGVEESEEHHLLMEFYAELRSNQLTLPSVPDVAWKVRRLVDREDTAAAQIANAVSADPAMAAIELVAPAGPAACLSVLVWRYPGTARPGRDDRGGGRGRDDGDNKENNSEETTNTGDDAANESVDTGDAAASTETEA